METGKFDTVSHWKQIWDIWDIRVLILFSLFLQICVSFSGPLRKRTSSSCIIIPMWLAYMLADATAIFAVGLISKSQSQNHEPGPSVHGDLLALWAAIFLVHLGGPDTITAFTLEDNDLWRRHLLQLVYQCATTAYVFILTLPESKIQLPTILMFVCGFVKYIERTRSLYLASSRRFRTSLLDEPNPTTNNSKHVDDNHIKGTEKPESISKRIESIKPELLAEGTDIEDKSKNSEKDLEVVKQAFYLFNIFKGLIVDLTLSFHERDSTRAFFLNRSAKDAIKMIEIELNFFYAILYTKVSVVQGKYGYLRRFISFTLNTVSLVLFFSTEKKGFHNFDVCITYILLLGAIALDMIAFLMALFSDWNAVALTQHATPPLILRIIDSFLNVIRKRGVEESSIRSLCSFGWFTQIVPHRWSKSISQFNLLQYCLHPRPKLLEPLVGLFGLTDMLDRLNHVETVQFPDDLGDFIFEELRLKSNVASDFETSMQMFSSRGDWVILDEGCTDLLQWISQMDFDKSLLLWHVATEICLQTETVTCDDPEDDNSNNLENAENYDFRKFSKLLSNYMLYLVMHSSMMSAVTGIGLIRFRDTCAEVKKFFHDREVVKEECYLDKISISESIPAVTTLPGREQSGNTKEKIHTCINLSCFGRYGCKEKKELDEEMCRKACKNIHDVNTIEKPIDDEQHESKSVLSDGCMLANELNKLGERKWKIMSRIWVEMLSYAACRCRASIHVAQLSKGGQLITFVWLLMAHFGLSGQFQMSEASKRSQL